MENFKKATVEPNDLGWTNWKNCKQIGNDVDNVAQQEFYKIDCKAFIIIQCIDAHACLHGHSYTHTDTQKVVNLLCFVNYHYQAIPVRT